MVGGIEGVDVVFLSRFDSVAARDSQAVVPVAIVSKSLRAVIAVVSHSRELVNNT